MLIQNTYLGFFLLNYFSIFFIFLNRCKTTIDDNTWFRSTFFNKKIKQKYRKHTITKDNSTNIQLV